VSVAQLGRRLADNKFVRHNAIFFVGSVATGVLNYAYYPIIGRFLPPAAFGEVQVLVSLFLQLTILLTVLSMITVNIVANYRDSKLANEIIFEIEKLAFIVGAFLLLATLVASPQLQSFFRFSSPLPFTALALALVAGVPLTFRSAYLRGKHAFGLTSWANIIAAGSKIVFSLGLVILGLNTLGAIAGIVAAQVAAGAYAAIYARRLGLWRLPGAFKKWPSLARLKPEVKYAGLVLITSLAITFHYSIDIIAAKHYFDAHTAGLYAGIATVGRILFFLTASIVQVLLPSVKLNNKPGQNRRVLLQSLALLCGLSLPVLLVFMLWPEPVVTMLMGKNYNNLANLLPNIGLSMVFIAIANLIMGYFVALRRSSMAFVGIIDFVVACGWMLNHHESVSAVVESLLFSSVATLGLLGMWVIGYKIKKRLNT
jgi:O-antigen/teichoic acid export membrane protein